MLKEMLDSYPNREDKLFLYLSNSVYESCKDEIVNDYFEDVRVYKVNVIEDGKAYLTTNSPFIDEGLNFTV